MPDAYGFDHLPDSRRGDRVLCIEPGCGFGGNPWEFGEEIRHEHYLTHYREAQTLEGAHGITYEVQGDVRIQPCRTCGKDFSQARRRGRPRLTCEVCSG